MRRFAAILTIALGLAFLVACTGNNASNSGTPPAGGSSGPASSCGGGA